MKRRITFLLTAFLLLTGMTSWGQLRTEASIDFSEQGYENAQDMDGVVIDIDDNVTIVFNKGTGTNSPKYYNTGTAIRAYGGNNFVVSSTATINSITLTFSSGEGTNAITTDVGVFESTNWTGSSSEVTFTVGGTSGHRRVRAVDVIYTDGGGQPTVATPTFNPTAGTYYEAQTVTINCSTEGATIHYTIDGTNPTESSPVYDNPISISETTTVKAFAMKEGYLDSGIASAIYTIAEAPSVITIAEARALELNEYALVQGVVTFIDGRNVYIQDETAGIDLYLNNNTLPENLALGDMVQAYGKRANYNGLAELSNINGNDSEQFSILSSGNVLPLAVKTIAEILEGGADALQCTRVKIEAATIGAINTSGNTPLTQGENSTNIYKVPALTGIEEGDVVDVIGVVGYFNVPQIRVALADDVTLSETPVQPDPQLNVSVTELNDFGYVEGSGPSPAMSFTVSASDLSAPIVLTAPDYFEIALPDGDYVSTFELSPISGTIDETTINVRMAAGLAAGNYSGTLTIASAEVSASIALNGTVSVSHQPELTANPTSISGLDYAYTSGGPSEHVSFLISGNYLSNDVNIYPSENFEVSTLPGNTFQPENPVLINIPETGYFNDISIYVRLKAGLEPGTYTEQVYAVSEGADTLFVTLTGTVSDDTPTPPPTPSGDYVRISDLSQLAEGNLVVFAARFDENATDYYTMTNASSGKPTGVLFTSTISEGNEILPDSIADEESSYYWMVGVTANGYTFTNAEGELIGYTSSTNFATGGDNTEWAIEMSTAGDGAMVPEYTGFVISNVNNVVRAFALNSNHNFGPYHTQNMNGNGYNFYLDLFVKTDSIIPPTPTVATPIFTPAAGTYYEAQSVSITCATDGATIYYSTETENGPWTAYTEAITVEENMTIWAYAAKEGYNDSDIAEATYTIHLGMVTIFSQDWEGEMNGWTFVTVQGDNPWNIAQYQGNHYAYANGYNGGVNEQWCISPGFNMHDYSDVILSFRNAKNYTGPDLELKYSTNYDGVDPTTANWWTFDFNMSPGSYTWVESGDISISITPYPAHDCYIAFKYTTTETEAAAWIVDDIMLMGVTYVPNLTVTPSSLSGFTHVVGEGPSESQYFTLSGVNIGPAPGGGSTGTVIIQSSENEFEVSLDNETFSWQVYIDGINGTLPPTPVYVRMNGAEVGQYTATVEISSSSSDEATVTLSGTVTEPPVPSEDYVRISHMSQLVDGNHIVFAARFDENANDYYAMRNAASGKPEGVMFTSTLNGNDEILPASILDEEGNFYWTVNVTADGYTFTNAAGDMIGYTSSTNFSPNGDNTAWSIEIGTSEETAMVPNYTGFVIANVNNPVRAFALNGNHNFGSYHTQNMAGENYNFFLDIFMQGEGGEPPTPTVAAPTFDPAGGTYYEPQNVTISCATEGATIHYSFDGIVWDSIPGVIHVDENKTIWAYATKEGYNDSPVVSAEYIIQDDLVIIFNQDWEDDWNGWTEVCVAGDSLWRIASYQGNHYAYANGYNHPVTEDWLISPAFDLDSYDDVVLSFRTAMYYTGPALEVFFSNDYDGQDPTTATWEELECELSQGGWNWVEASVNLDEFSGSNCYIGFKYTSDEDAAGWEVDDIMLVSGSATPIPTLTATPNTINGLDYIEGEGPSDSQTYILTGNNLDCSEVTIHVEGEFRISLDEIDWTADTTMLVIDGQIVGQTIYVRMVEGLEMGTYEGTITHNCGEASAEVSLTGVVHSENVPYILWNDLPHYIQGNNGSNNNRVPVATFLCLQNLEPNTTYRYTNQFVVSDDGPETAGAGNVIYANLDGFYRSTSPSLGTEGGYGEFTTNWDGDAYVWFVNEPTANARFTPGNHVYLRIRLNDGHDGTTVEHTFTTEDYATVINFGTEHDANQGTAFYVKSNENPMTFAQLFSGYMDPENPDTRPIFSTIVETTGVDFGSINQYADFYKDEVAGKDGWFGGILPNDNEYGINKILVFDITHYWFQDYYTAEFNGHWNPDANTVNPTNGLDEPIFIDLTDDGVNDNIEANIKVWSTDHEFVIENGDDADYTMTVYNVLGQQMMQQQINAGSTECIGHSLAADVYVISLQNNQKKVSVKVIVK